MYQDCMERRKRCGRTRVSGTARLGCRGYLDVFFVGRLSNIFNRFVRPHTVEIERNIYVDKLLIVNTSLLNLLVVQSRVVVFIP